MNRRTQIVYGSAEWWILDSLKKFGSMKKAEILTIGTHETPAALTNLTNLHMAVRNLDNQIEITPKGRLALMSSNKSKPNAIVPTVATPKSDSVFKREDYDGRELLPYDVRPGAMDAFSLPSLMSGRLVMPKGMR